jgi:hypothetical protein
MRMNVGELLSPNIIIPDFPGILPGIKTFPFLLKRQKLERAFPPLVLIQITYISAEFAKQTFTSQRKGW